LSVSVEIKLLRPGAKLPVYGSEQAAGADVSASITEPVLLEPGQRVAVPCGFSMALPVGYEAQIRPRSGLALRYGVSMVNTPGTIDSDYRGELMVILINHGQSTFKINNGDRIAQMVIAPITTGTFVLKDELENTQRGSGGFGSTGI